MKWLGIDVGGTFTVSTEGRIGPYPLQLQQIEIDTIGAGERLYLRRLRRAKVG
jgi:N-methylhydantoinase A/oxoprolinase/acetone carboxylase beta subunit